MEAITTVPSAALFTTREEAGELLSAHLSHLADSAPCVLGVPGGGVLVAAPIAKAIDGELGLAEILPHPALGRRAAATARMRAASAAQRSILSPRTASEQILREGSDCGANLPDVLGRVVILVDDGLHSESDVHDMLKAIRAHGARKTILALPYATKSSLFRHESEADTLVALHILEMPLLPNAVYEDYRSPSFEQVQALLCGESVDVDGDLAPLFHRALVAVDFSPCSTRAVRYASRLVGPEGELALLHVVPGTLDTEDFQALENAIEDLRELERRRVPPGIESVRVVTTGSIDESIIRASIAGSHEVIVMGTHGRTGVQRLLLGSVAERVVRQSDIPVLVVPA